MFLHKFAEKNNVKNTEKITGIKRHLGEYTCDIYTQNRKKSINDCNFTLLTNMCCNIQSFGDKLSDRIHSFNFALAIQILVFIVDFKFIKL